MPSVRFALIGAGNIAKIYVAACEEIDEAQITVLCSRTESSGSELAATCGADWEKDYTVAVARDDVDAVIVATPSGTHAEISVTAAQAGKHLLVEKPIEITLPRVDAIIEAAEKAGVILACVFPLRFGEGPTRVKAAVEAGRIGRLTMADAYVKWYRPQSYYDGSWRGTWTLDGGGALMNQAIHNIDLVQWLAGPVAEIQAQVATLAHEMETEDTAVALLRYENGALGVIQGATSAWPGDPARVELHGDKGTIVLEEGQIVQWELQDGSEEEQAEMLALDRVDGSGAGDPMAIGHEKHRRQLIDLIEAIQSGRAPAIQGAEARRSVEIVRAIYRSAEAGTPVALPLASH